MKMFSLKYLSIYLSIYQHGNLLSIKPHGKKNAKSC